MPFLMPMGFIGSPAAVGSSGTASAGTLVGTFLDTDVSSNVADNYTFSGVSFGTAAANRLIIVAVGHRSHSVDTAPPPTSMTIGGVAATKVKSAEDLVGESAGTSIWQALVPTGTSGTVVVSFSGSPDQSNCGIAVWSITTNNQAAQFTGASTAGSSIAATVPTDGYGIVSYHVDITPGSSPTVTPSNYTEDFETALSLGGTHEGGHFTTSATIDSTPSSAESQAMVYASWGP